MNVTNNQVEIISSVSDEMGGLILFDGVCGLCNKFVQFVLSHDPQGHFTFASLQSNLAKEVLRRHGKNPETLKSVYLIKNRGEAGETLYCKSDAAIRVLSELQGPTKNLKIFLGLPAPIRDIGYDLVAAIRYKLFGRYDTCPLPNPAQRARFLDI